MPGCLAGDLDPMKSVNQEAVEQDPQQLHEDLHDIWGNPKG